MSGPRRPRGGPKAPAQPRQQSRRAAAPAEQPQRVQKLLADLGLGSRREIETWISAGRISVNGVRAVLGSKASAQDQISLDGRPLSRRSQAKAALPRVLLLNKLEGVVCSRRDPEGRPTCFDQLPPLRPGRWINVGRLDVATSGLLLFTNDGALAHALMHPSSAIDREYAARVDRQLDAATMQALVGGVLLDDGMAKFSDLQHAGGSQRNHWYHLTITEGRNREVRRLFESQQVQVSRLKRVRFGPVVLPSALKRGQFLEMNPADVSQLLALVALPVPPLQPPDPKARYLAKYSVLVPYPPLAERQALFAKA